MARKTLIAVCAAALAVASAASAGPVLDEILNYMFMDQSVPMKGPQQLFDVQRTIYATREEPIGQTFVTGPETDRIVRVRAFLAPDWEWQRGEGAELVLWDSPEKNISLGRYTIWYEYRGFQFKQAEWEINAKVRPDTTYYFEIGYVGDGDGKAPRIGVMNGRDAYKGGQGYLAGEEADFDICFQTHSKRPMDRIGNLKKTFARFDLERPELRAVKQAVDNEDFEQAIARTVAYFEARQSPTSIIRPGDIPRYNPDFDTTQADLAMQNYFQRGRIGGGYAGPDIKWRAVVDFDERGVPKAGNYDLNRYGPRGTLANAYLNTGNEKYAKKLNDMLIDWYIDNPPPGESNIGGSPWDTVWASLQTGIRLGQASAGYPYSHLHASPNFTRDCRMAYILSLADHADTLVLVGEGAGGNWSFTQNSSLLTFALNFPEFKNAGKWFDVACERLAGSLKKDWLPDGVETESAPGYQRMAYKPLAHIYQLTRERGVQTPFTSQLRGLLEKQSEYFMYLAMPNGRTPFLGDWGDTQERPALQKDSERYDRPDMLYVATAGKKGTKPSELSKLYPYAGVVTMRSDWGDVGAAYEDARYLMLHGLHFGAHGHADINGVTLYAYGRELLTDPGSHIYGSPEHALLTTAPSHNLMTIDGKNQIRHGKTAFRNWSTTPVADYLSSWGAVYKAGDYNREVFYVRANGDPDAEDYWVIRDTAEGTGTHSLEQRWHFWGEVNVDETTLTSSTSFEDKGNLAVLQLEPSRLEVEQTTTDTWRPRGVAVDPQKLPTIVYKTNTALPAAINTVLLPFEYKQVPRARLEPLENSADGLDSVFKVVQGDIEDLFVLQRLASEKDLAAEKVSFDGERLFVRRIEGKLRSTLLIKGSSLIVDGQQVLKSGKPVSWVAVSFSPSEVSVYTGSEEPTLSIPAAGDRKITVVNTNTDRLLIRDDAR